MKNSLFYFSLVLLFTLWSCSGDVIEKSVETIEKPIVIPETQRYIHISHTRTDTNPSMDTIIENLDYSNYDMLWLGGDLAFKTSVDDETMNYVNSVFDIGNENTLWALGNHDYSNLKRVQQFTNRPPYYSYNKNGITFIVLDTQENFSSITGAQKDFFDDVIDNLQDTTHLVILHHKLIWMYGNPDLEPQISMISNGNLGDCSYCINPNNFYQDIYPSLVASQQKGIKVICIGGDIGNKVKEFEYITTDGIYFLASGIFSGEKDNSVLQFHHNVTNKTLNWEYKLTQDL